MRTRFLNYIAIALIAIVFFACKDTSDFTISGEVKNPGSLKKIYLLAADTSTIKIIDSAALSDGKFEFKHHTPYANLYKLRVGGSIFDLIARDGENIKFSTSLTDDTRTYQVTGSEDSKKIQEFNKISNFYGAKNSKLADEYQAKVQKVGKESDSLIKEYMPMFQKNLAEYSMDVIKFVNNNKASLAGFYAATSLDQIKYETELINYADEIKGNFKDNPAVQKFVKLMMDAKPLSVGHKAPEFTSTGLDGNPVKLADYKGKYVMLDFWASWCQPCRQENPNVVKQYAIFKPKGFNILGISLDVDKKSWQQAINTDHLTWAHVSDLKTFDGPTENLYHIQAIPSNYIIDPQGIIVAKNITGADLEEFLNKTFSKVQ